MSGKDSVKVVLLFFYENFPVIDGRVSINQIKDFYEINSEKNF